MKNVLTIPKKVILMVAMMATVMGYANEISLIKLGKGLKGTALTITNVKEGNQLSIKDNYGITLYKETIEQAGIYSKGFDLTDLPDGEYLFELEKDMEINTIPFSVKSSIVELKRNEEVTTFKPFLRQEAGLLYVTKFSPKSKPLKVSIYSTGTSNELLYTETIKDVQNIERVYKLERGSYELVFNFEGKEFAKHINN